MSLLSFFKNLINKKPVQNKEDYFNSKYPKTDLTYKREETDGQYQVDLRNFIQEDDSTIPTVSGLDDDSKALSALTLVIASIKYLSDKEDYGYPEYWAYGYQTMKRKKGDCEDGAILLHNILLKSGVPYWKLRITAGNVSTGEGHCYLVYYVESLDRWVALDWCFFPNTRPVVEREDYKESKIYGDVWFSWNKKYCFTQGLNTAARKMLGSRR